MLSSGPSSLFCSSPIPTSSPFNLPPLPPIMFISFVDVGGRKANGCSLSVKLPPNSSYTFFMTHFQVCVVEKIKIDFLSPTFLFFIFSNFVGFSLPVNVDFSVAAAFFFIHQSSNNNIQSSHSPPTLALCTLCFNSFVVFFLLSSNHQPDVTSAQCSFSIKNKGGFYTLCYFHSTLTPATCISHPRFASDDIVCKHHARH